MKNKLIIGFILGMVAICAMAATLARYPIYTATPTLIQTGTCCAAANGTVTNTFPIVFGTIPQVICTQIGATNSVSNFIVTLNTTNFVINSGGPNISNSWSAIGSP